MSGLEPWGLGPSFTPGKDVRIRVGDGYAEFTLKEARFFSRELYGFLRNVENTKDVRPVAPLGWPNPHRTYSRKKDYSS